MQNTAKHFVLQLGSLASLYLTVSFLVTLLFGVITIMYPDAANGAYERESAHSSVRLGIAMVLVFFPTYVVLTRFVNQQHRQKGGSYSGLTKWLIYISLLVGGGVLLGDLVAVIMTFLEGELTTRFLLKALTVVIVVGSAFFYYMLDARGYWLKREKNSMLYGAGATAIVLLSLVFGFSNIETPTMVREQKLDVTQVNDLGQIQWRVQDYYLLNGSLPKSLGDLGEPEVPKAPDGRPAYEYRVTDGGFELCATFAEESTQTDYYGGTYPVMEKSLIRNPDSWQHGAGEHCFERSISPITPGESPAPTKAQ